MSEQEAVIESQLALFLAEERNGTSLPGALVEPLIEHLMERWKVKKVPGDLPEVLEEWLSCATEAFEAKSSTMPSGFEMRLRRYFKGDAGLGLLAGKMTPPPKSGGGPPESAYAVVALEVNSTPGVIEQQFTDHQVNGHTRINAIADMKSEGLTLTQILALSVGLETGKIVPSAEVESMVYGGDVRVCNMVKELRRSEVPTLSSLLKAGKMQPVISHLTALLRDFSLHGLMREAALLSSWMQEWQQMLAGEDTVAIAYLSEYVRTYPGRGLPTEFDFRIYFRVMKGYGASGSEAVKELAKTVKALQGTVGQLTEQCSSHKKKIDGLQTKAAGGGFDRKTGKVGPCHICGKMGHLAKDCPDKEDEEH